MKPPIPFPAAVLRRLPFRVLCLCLGILPGPAARGDDTLPPPPPANRYAKLAAHSPFAPPTAGGAPAGPKETPTPAPAWSDNLTVTSLMQNGNVYTATLIEKDSSAHHLIRSDVVEQDTQLIITGVRWADKPDAIKITVRKGTQFGDVRFDPSAASASAPPVPGAPPPMVRPGLPNPAANFRPPPPSAAAQNPGNFQPPGNIVHGRPVIRATPTSPLVRPVVTAPQTPGRPVTPPPAKAGKDDDDDDDDN